MEGGWEGREGREGGVKGEEVYNRRVVNDEGEGMGVRSDKGDEKEKGRWLRETVVAMERE